MDIRKDYIDFGPKKVVKAAPAREPEIITPQILKASSKAARHLQWEMEQRLHDGLMGALIRIEEDVHEDKIKTIPPRKPKTYSHGGPCKTFERKNPDGSRPLTLEKACAKYPHRFTMEHVPRWALKPCARGDGNYPGPHFITDCQWYEASEFLGENTTSERKYCRTLKLVHPLGKWLEKPFDKESYKAKKEKKKSKKQA